MVFICAQPDDKYFAWQIEVMINNFRKFGYSDKMHILLYKPADRKNWNTDFDILETRYPEVKFFKYEDKGALIKAYIPILRPHILKQHFQAHPELEKEVIFYHDCDILLTRKLDIEMLEQGDTWFMSDTNGYISYDYFASKAKDVKPAKSALFEVDKVLEPILSSIGITVDQFKQNNGNSGGAQYILKGVNAEFWDKIERDAINIYLYFKSQNVIYFINENKGIQRWCADMWAILWNGIRLNKDIKITKELDFSWATDKIEIWTQKPIYHNAGATGDPHIFFKGKYHNNATTPFHQEITGISKDYASYMYFQAIQEVKNKYYQLVT